MRMEMKEEKIQRLRILSNKIRKDILELTFHAGKNGAHIGGAFSSAEILAVLYGEILKVSPELPYGPERDRFILSKGHTAVGLYKVILNLSRKTGEYFLLIVSKIRKKVLNFQAAV